MNFWSLGAILAALVTLCLLNNLPPDVGWRAAFGFGAVIALCAGLVRRYIPESPRWLLARGKAEAAEAVVENIEKGRFENPAKGSFGFVLGTASAEKYNGFWRQSHELVTRYPGRTALGCLLDFSEAAGYYGLFAFLALFILPAVALPFPFVPLFFFFCDIRALARGFAGPTFLF